MSECPNQLYIHSMFSPLKKFDILDHNFISLWPDLNTASDEYHCHTNAQFTLFEIT